jgi:hypothetical protein
MEAKAASDKKASIIDKADKTIVIATINLKAGLE